eukprot:4619271-Heterocapsa_arctica.AAC.1
MTQGSPEHSPGATATPEEILPHESSVELRTLGSLAAAPWRTALSGGTHLDQLTVRWSCSRAGFLRSPLGTLAFCFLC